MSVGADGRDGSVASAQSVGFFVALVLYGDPDPSESGASKGLSGPFLGGSGVGSCLALGGDRG